MKIQCDGFSISGMEFEFCKLGHSIGMSVGQTLIYTIFDVKRAYYACCRGG